MANKQFNELTDGVTPQDGDVMAVDRGGGPWSTVKLTLLSLYTYMLGKLVAAGRLIPDGGTTRQVLAKSSDANYALSYQTLREVPDTGTTNHYLRRTGAGATDYAFAAISYPDQSAGTFPQVQYKSGSGGFAGASKTEIGASGSLLQSVDAAPSTPAAGKMANFARAIANRAMPAFVGPNGVDSAVQPFFGRNKIGYWAPVGNSSAAPLADGIAAPTLYGSTGARNVAATNILTSMRRLANASAGTAGATGGWRHPTAQFFRSTDPWGGFFFVCRFGEDNTLADSRCFVGMHTATTAIGNVNPSTLLNIIGMGFDSGETNWRILHNDGSGTATKIDLGTDFPCNTNDQAYEIAIFAPPGQSSVWVQVTRLGTAFSVTHEISSSDLPALGTLLTFHIIGNNGTTASAKTMTFTSVYIETDY